MRMMCLSMTLIATLLVCSACSYNSRTGKTRFTPLGPGVHEIIDTVVSDVSECAGRDKACEKTTSQDGYEESRVKAMTTEEFTEYVEQQK